VAAFLREIGLRISGPRHKRIDRRDDFAGVSDGVLGRSGIFVACVALFMTLLPQNPHRDDLLTNISSGKSRVLDLSYAINDKLVPWPGDTRWFESQVTRRSRRTDISVGASGCWSTTGRTWMRPFIFPREKSLLTRFPRNNFSGLPSYLDVRADAARDADFSAFARAR